MIFSKKSLNKFTHNYKTLVCAKSAVITGAGGKSDDFVAVANTYSKIEKTHGFCFIRNAGNIYVVAVDIEAKVFGKANGKYFKSMNTAVGSKINILVIGNKILIGICHKGFKFRTGLFKRNKAVSQLCP